MKYQKNSRTSYEASLAILDSANTLRASVYRAIKTADKEGATDEELQFRLQMNPSTQRPRRVELVEMGVVKDSGMTRKTASNRNAVVWIASKSTEKQGELF